MKEMVVSASSCFNKIILPNQQTTVNYETLLHIFQHEEFTANGGNLRSSAPLNVVCCGCPDRSFYFHKNSWKPADSTPSAGTVSAKTLTTDHGHVPSMIQPCQGQSLNGPHIYRGQPTICGTIICSSDLRLYNIPRT